MPKTKEKLLQEFAEMEALEAEARDFYAETAVAKTLTHPTVRRVFQVISAEEQAHVEIVQKIQRIIQGTF